MEKDEFERQERAARLREMDAVLGKLIAETGKLAAETGKLHNETRWMPMVLGTGAALAGVAVAKLFM